MTGLDLNKDVLVEIAVIVTDAQLTPLDDGIDVVIDAPDGILDTLNPVVFQMHEKSGLLADLTQGLSIPMAEAEKTCLDYIKQFVPEAGKAQLAGNTVGTDRAFLAKDMPELEQYLHYRNVDVSTIKELAKRWYPKAFFNAPKKNGNHRALADIQESIEELRYWREVLFVAEPGPSSDELKAAAQKHQGSLTGTRP